MSVKAVASSRRQKVRVEVPREVLLHLGRRLFCLARGPGRPPVAGGRRPGQKMLRLNRGVVRDMVAEQGRLQGLLPEERITERLLVVAALCLWRGEAFELDLFRLGDRVPKLVVLPPELKRWFAGRAASLRAADRTVTEGVLVDSALLHFLSRDPQRRLELVKSLLGHGG